MLESLMASSSMLKPDTFTGPTWAFRARTMVRSSASISMVKNRVTIIGEGKTFTPKQLHLEKKSGKLYWCDREGMRVMRANLDGSNIETLVDTSKGDARPGTDLTKWCVGITVDPDRGQIYWTQKGPDNAGKGRIFRAKIDIPKGETAANRTDIEVLFDGLPEPIDLELDLKNRLLYWTDRGDPPRGNTVNRASMDADFSKHPTPDILLTHLDGGNRDRSRFQREPDVPHRFSRLDLLRQTRRLGKETAARRAGKSHRHRLRRNSETINHQQLTINYYVIQQTNTSHRHRWHWSHRRQLGR